MLHLDRQRGMDLVAKTFHVQNHRLLTAAAAVTAVRIIPNQDPGK